MRYLIKIISFSAFLIQLLAFHTEANDKAQGVKQFDKLTYGAASQNWGVSSTSQGIIYFANHQGLLEFDGTTWTLYKLPNQNFLRAVKVKSDSIIYSSGYMELGFWKSDNFGKLQYYSLTPKAQKYFTKNIEFWNIATTDNAVYFHSFAGILSYHSDSVSTIELPGFSSVMSKVNDKVLVAINNDGIYEITDNSTKPIIQDDFFNGKLIRFILPYKNSQLLIGTASHGIFIWNKNEFRQWKPEWREYFIENELNRGIYSDKGQLIIGTIIDGVVVFDKAENLQKKVNIENGLLNNTVLGIDADVWGNTWLALDDGIGFVSHKTKTDFSIEEIPGVGAIYSTAILDNNIYFGTNQGLFVKSPKASRNSPELITGTQGQIWDIKIIDGKLWAGHNHGTFLVEGRDAKIISPQSGGFAIKQDTKNSKRFIQSTYSNLVTYTKSENNSITVKNIDGFYDLIRYLEIDHLGNIWASHMHRGVFKLVTDDARENVEKTSYFGEEVFGKDYSIHVFKIENRIVFTTNEKLFTYDDLKDTIVPYIFMNEKLGKFSLAHRIVEAPNHHYWFICDNCVGLFEINNENISLIKEVPTSLFSTTPLVNGFENIFPVTDRKAVLCLQNGIASLDATIADSSFLLHQYQPVIRQIEIYNNRGKNKLLPLNTSDTKFNHNFNNVVFRFSFPHINELDINYQCFLEGLNIDWTGKTSNPEFRFERLPAGKYNLKVKATDLWENESQVYSIQFEIKPPWYISSLALFAYFILFILFIIGFSNWRIQQTRKKVQKQFEAREKELIKLRNEKLRNEVEYKSKELANSTLAIIKKNEFLLNLKKTIDKQKVELGSRYPDKYFNYLNKKIDDSITNQDDWQIFETNFERAHEQFFGKLKESYPELSSNDLRLCAYLRMNLSSKEIAPLLGISVRGVENHRYKLRKKFNLEHDDSLVETIISI